MGGGDVSSGLAIEFLRAYAEEADVSEEELQAAAIAEGIPPEAVAQGVPHEGWVIAFAKVLERLLPTKGKYVASCFCDRQRFISAIRHWQLKSKAPLQSRSLLESRIRPS